MVRSPKQSVFDLALVFVQPIEVGVEVVFIETIQVKQVTNCVRAGQAHGGQARAVFDDAGHDLPECELGLSPCSQGVNDVELLGEAQQNPDGSDAQALLKLHAFVQAGELREVALVFKAELDGLDFFV